MVAAIFFGAPLYLLAIYPDSPPLPPWCSGRTFRSLALENFWYRLAFCGGMILFGALLLLFMRRWFSHRLDD
jgi:hypothetical protein